MIRIQQVIEAAAASAAKLPMPHQPAPPALTMDGLVDQSPGIDAWIIVSKFGFTIGGGDQVFKSVVAELDLAAVRPCAARPRTTSPSRWISR